MTYMMPGHVQSCRCANTGDVPFFCPTGHMLECHYPLNCRQAACGHMPKYEDLSQEEMAEMEEDAKNLLSGTADKNCESCKGVGRTEVSSSINLDGRDLTLTGWAICPCVPRALGALDFPKQEAFDG